MTHRLKITKTLTSKLAFAFLLIGIAIVFACSSADETPDAETSDTASETSQVSSEAPLCEDLIPTPEDRPPGPPPGMPYIFEGTAYVDGEPAPEGEMLYVKLAASRSRHVRILPNGEYRNIIHGPVHDFDAGVPFVFCLGDPDGKAVRSIEIVEYEDMGTFNQIQMDINFPIAPSKLGSQ